MSAERYFQAADAVKKLARQYEHLVAAAEALDKMGSFEQAAAEAEDRSKRAAVAAASEKAALAQLHQDVESTKALAVAIEDRAHASAKAILDAAVQKAKDLVDVSRANAEGVKANAQAVAKRLTDDAAAVVASARRQKADIDAQRKAVQEGIDRGQVVLAEIEAKIANAREQVKRMLG